MLLPFCDLSHWDCPPSSWSNPSFLRLLPRFPHNLCKNSSGFHKCMWFALKMPVSVKPPQSTDARIRVEISACYHSLWNIWQSDNVDIELKHHMLRRRHICGHLPCLRSLNQVDRFKSGQIYQPVGSSPPTTRGPHKLVTNLSENLICRGSCSSSGRRIALWAPRSQIDGYHRFVSRIYTIITRILLTLGLF